MNPNDFANFVLGASAGIIFLIGWAAWRDR